MNFKKRLNFDEGECFENIISFKFCDLSFLAAIYKGLDTCITNKYNEHGFPALKKIQIIKRVLGDFTIARHKTMTSS